MARSDETCFYRRRKHSRTRNREQKPSARTCPERTASSIPIQTAATETNNSSFSPACLRTPLARSRPQQLDPGFFTPRHTRASGPEPSAVPCSPKTVRECSAPPRPGPPAADQAAGARGGARSPASASPLPSPGPGSRQRVAQEGGRPRPRPRHSQDTRGRGNPTGARSR